MSLFFFQDKSTLYSDLHQSNSNSMHSSNDYSFFDHILYLELIGDMFSFGLFCVGISITISIIYQFVFISEHILCACVCVCVCVCAYSYLYIHYIVFILLYSQTYISNFTYILRQILCYYY